MSEPGGTPSTPSGKGRQAPATRQNLSAERRLSGMQTTKAPDYLVIGHICADLRPDGTAVLGGTALYSALTASRLGWRVGVLTRGVYGRKVDGIDIPSLDAFADEISIIVQDAETPTMFVNEYQADRRVQTMPKWAGEIDLRGLPPHWRNSKLIHLGPVAQEINPRDTGALTPDFLGLTPQGWMRDWPRPGGGRVKLMPLRIPGDLRNRLDAIVVSDEEILMAREAVSQVGERRLGVITRGEGGARIFYGGERADLPGYNVKVKDLTGAGDVFAASFFIRATDRTVSAIRAGRFANAVAALSLREAGPYGIPSLIEAETFLQEQAEKQETRGGVRGEIS